MFKIYKVILNKYFKGMMKNEEDNIIMEYGYNMDGSYFLFI